MSINPVARAFSVSTTDRNLTAHAGAVLIRAAAHAVGLGSAITAHLRLKKRARGLTEAESILSMAEAVALGARNLSTTLRHISSEISESPPLSSNGSPGG